MIYLILGYIYLAIHRPMEIWPVLEPFRVELVYFSFLCLTWIIAPKRFSFDRQQLAVVLIGAAVALAWALSPWADRGAIAVKNYTFVLVFALILATCVRDEPGLDRVLLAFLGVMALYMLHSVWEYRSGRHVFRMGIVRLVGVDSSLGDPNSFGNSIVYALPFVRYFWLKWQERWKRLMLVGYVLLSVGCIGLTGSRSSMVGLLLWGFLTVWVSRRRKVALLLGGAVLAAGAFFMLPDDLQTRFWTIVDPSVGPINAQWSREGRIEGFFIGLDLWSKFPLTGCGPDAWQAASGRYLRAHNVYGQLLGELGTVGAVAFLFLVVALISGGRRLIRLVRDHDPEPHAEPLFHFGHAVLISTALLLFEGLFGHNLYRYNYVWYCSFLVIAQRAYLARVAEYEEPAPATAGELAWA